MRSYTRIPVRDIIPTRIILIYWTKSPPGYSSRTQYYTRSARKTNERSRVSRRILHSRRTERERERERWHVPQCARHCCEIVTYVERVQRVVRARLSIIILVTPRQNALSGRPRRRNSVVKRTNFLSAAAIARRAYTVFIRSCVPTYVYNITRVYIYTRQNE